MSLPDKELKQKMIEYAAENPIASSVCKKCGISRATLNRWLEKDKRFKKAFLKAQQQGRSAMYDVASSRIMSLVNSPDGRVSFQASKFVADRIKVSDESVAHFKQVNKDEHKPDSYGNLTFSHGNSQDAVQNKYRQSNHITFVKFDDTAADGV